MRQVREVQRKPVPAFAIFQVPLPQNNQCTKVVRYEIACPEFFHNFLSKVEREVPLRGKENWAPRSMDCVRNIKL